MSEIESRLSGASATASRTNRASLRARISARVGFWRALLEFALIGNLIQLPSWPVAVLFGSPWAEVVSYGLLSIYIYAAWRLAPGTGSLPRRIARVLAWALLLTVLSSAVAWLILLLIPYPSPFLGNELTLEQYPFGLIWVGAVLLVGGLFLPARLLVSLWSIGQARLRWQLTSSYLLLGVLTMLTIPVAFGLYVGLVNLFFALNGVPLQEDNLVVDQVITAINVTLFSTTLALSILPFVSLFILPLALGIGYLLARRLTHRMEQLAQASNALAHGDLARRVTVDTQDEIGRLGADFNAMAARLEEREHALLAEKARVEEREAALRVEKERVEYLLQTNRNLVASVSHELRTPLATLRGYVEALEQDHGEHLPQRDIAVIHGEINRLTGLIEDLFTLARAETQQLPLRIESIDATDVVQHLMATLAPLARREREIEMVATLPDTLAPISADRVRLEQVLINLAQNALRHTPPGGIIAFEGSSDDTHVTLSVADTGVGIAEEELTRIFERFYRGEKSRARETGGAGIGLALVRELTEAMGGSVTVESRIGQGSRFSITLKKSLYQTE